MEEFIKHHQNNVSAGSLWNMSICYVNKLSKKIFPKGFLSECVSVKVKALCVPDHTQPLELSSLNIVQRKLTHKGLEC